MSPTGERRYGVYSALVTDNKDPENLARVKVAIVGVKGRSAWARLATLMAGKSRGSYFVPDVNDEVLVAFEGGDPRRPYIVGSLWNGKDAPPESMDPDGKNQRKVLRSRSGVTLTLDDTEGAEQMILQTPGGQTITLRDGAGGITVTSAGKVNIAASTVEISAGMVTVNAGISKFSGVVQADTVIANSVVSASYSPGAGNIW